MKDPSDLIRTWIYGKLNAAITYGGAAVPVYSFPPKDAAMPYIVIGESSSDPEDSPKDSYITSNNVNIEIYASYSGNDATYKLVNSVAEDILELIRTRAKVTIAGYTVISVTNQGTVTDRFLLDTYTVIYKSLNINFLMEES